MVSTPPHPPARLTFHGQHAEEQYQFHVHQHWIRLVWPVCKMLLASTLIILFAVGAFFVAPIGDPAIRRILLTLLTLFFLLTHFELLSRFYRYLLYVVIATDKKFHRIKRSLLLIDEHESLDLWMLQDVFKVQRGLLQNMLGFGSIVLDAQETTLRIHYVPCVHDIVVKILSLREVARHQIADYAQYMLSAQVANHAVHPPLPAHSAAEPER